MHPPLGSEDGEVRGPDAVAMGGGSGAISASGSGGVPEGGGGKRLVIDLDAVADGVQTCDVGRAPLATVTINGQADGVGALPHTPSSLTDPSVRRPAGLQPIDETSTMLRVPGDGDGDISPLTPPASGRSTRPTTPDTPSKSDKITQFSERQSRASSPTTTPARPIPRPRSISKGNREAFLASQPGKQTAAGVRLPRPSVIDLQPLSNTPDQLQQEGLTLYDVLKLPADAQLPAIKKAYRKLALKCHPDKAGPDNKEAAIMFDRITFAYGILGSKQKRTVYDNFGYDGLRIAKDLDGKKDIVQQFEEAPQICKCLFYFVGCITLGYFCLCFCGCCHCCGGRGEKLGRMCCRESNPCVRLCVLCNYAHKEAEVQEVLSQHE